MLRNIEFPIAVLRVGLAGLLLAASLPLLALLPPLAHSESKASSSHHKSASTYSVAYNDSPNVVTSGLANSTAQASQTVDSTIDSMWNGLHHSSIAAYNGLRQVGSASAATARTGATYTWQAILYLGDVTERGANYTVNNVYQSAVFIARLPGVLATQFARIPSINGYLRPSAYAKTPTIETLHSAPSRDTRASSTASQNELLNITPDSSWPIRGRVTTLFGVPHRPFQPFHTGIDISSGQRSGVTEVKPFRTGQVKEVVWSRYGLGNHVIVSHGNGLTSVYAHLSSITVANKQVVDTNTVLGLEGTTGLSTGTHLHFEIRENGKPVNPKHYIKANL